MHLIVSLNVCVKLVINFRICIWLISLCQGNDWRQCTMQLEALFTNLLESDSEHFAV